MRILFSLYSSVPFLSESFLLSHPFVSLLIGSALDDGRKTRKRLWRRLTYSRRVEVRWCAWTLAFCADIARNLVGTFKIEGLTGVLVFCWINSVISTQIQLAAEHGTGMMRRIRWSLIWQDFLISPSLFPSLLELLLICFGGLLRTFSMCSWLWWINIIDLEKTSHIGRGILTDVSPECQHCFYTRPTLFPTHRLQVAYRFQYFLPLQVFNTSSTRILPTFHHSSNSWSTAWFYCVSTYGLLTALPLYQMAGFRPVGRE
jgi:hypothetical protein